MKTYFFLSRKRLNKKGKAPIYCRIQETTSNRYDLSTGLFVCPKDWDQRKGWVKAALFYEATKLQNFQHKIQRAITEGDLNNIDSARDVANIARGKKRAVYNKLSQLLDGYIEHARPSKNVLSRIRHGVKEFEACIKATLRDMDITVPTQFESKMRKQGLATSTIYKRQEIMKRLFEYCVNMSYMDKNPYRLYKLPVVVPKAKLFITAEQLYEIKCKIFAQQRLNSVKDVFLFQCYTGLSYADLKAFNMAKIKDVDGFRFIIGQRKKTKTTYHIPYLKQAETILVRHKDGLPILTNQKYNSYLKEIADLMGWDIQLTTHVGRKTFAQNMLDKGISWEAIASMLGHEKTTMTEKHYATLGLERVKLELSKMLAA